MGKKMETLKTRAATAIGLPADVVANLPRLSLVGQKQLVVENHRGIALFSPECISIKTTQGVIDVLGEGLLVYSINQEQVVLSGEIASLTFGSSTQKAKGGNKT